MGEPPGGAKLMVEIGLARAIISRSRTPCELLSTVGSTRSWARAAVPATVSPAISAAADVSDRSVGLFRRPTNMPDPHLARDKLGTTRCRSTGADQTCHPSSSKTAHSYPRFSLLWMSDVCFVTLFLVL